MPFWESHLVRTRTLSATTTMDGDEWGDYSFRKVPSCPVTFTIQMPTAKGKILRERNSDALPTHWFLLQISRDKRSCRSINQSINTKTICKCSKPRHNPFVPGHTLPSRYVNGITPFPRIVTKRKRYYKQEIIESISTVKRERERERGIPPRPAGKELERKEEAGKNLLNRQIPGARVSRSVLVDHGKVSESWP